MTRVLPRTNFLSSELLRRLIDLNIVAAAEPESLFAEKIGLWIHFADAITLSEVHHDRASRYSRISSQSQVNLSAEIAMEFDRIHTRLATSINTSCSPKSGKSHIQLPIPLLEPPVDVAAAYAPYRWFYDAHQRDMESHILPLRTTVRHALAKVSSTLKQLADLDAALEVILRERESKLLSKIPILLKKRFEKLLKDHQQNYVGSQQSNNPATCLGPTNWLNHFYSEMQTLLLSELELRLQPTIGLIEALNQNVHNE